VNLFEPGARLMKKEFTRPRSHKDWETLLYSTSLHCFQPLIIGVIYTRTWIMRMWSIWNSVSFQNRCVELLEQVHTVLHARIRMPKVDCSSLFLYVYVYLYLICSRLSRFEWMSVLVWITTRTRVELLKFKLHIHHILPKGAVIFPHYLACLLSDNKISRLSGGMHCEFHGALLEFCWSP